MLKLAEFYKKNFTTKLPCVRCRWQPHVGTACTGVSASPTMRNHPIQQCSTSGHDTAHERKQRGPRARAGCRPPRRLRMRPPRLPLVALLSAPPRIQPRMVSAASASRFELELLAPARLSLFLRILRRHDDGFHDSASLFQAVDVGDTLRLARIPGDRSAAAGVVRPSRTAEPVKQNVEFSASPAELPQLPMDETNSVVRALTLYRKKLAARDGGSFAVPRFRAHLVKRLPVGGGLGGAASDAAAALLGANELCGGLASPAELHAWGSELGGDVAAFLSASGAALCTGRSPFLRADAAAPLPPLAPLAEEESLFVVSPAVELSVPAPQPLDFAAPTCTDGRVMSPPRDSGSRPSSAPSTTAPSPARRPTRCSPPSPPNCSGPARSAAPQTTSRRRRCALARPSPPCEGGCCRQRACGPPPCRARDRRCSPSAHRAEARRPTPSPRDSRQSLPRRSACLCACGLRGWRVGG